MQLPSLIGKYELLEFLGGGMSHVYRSRDTVIDRPVVVKILTLDSCSDSEAKARFLQEARIAGNIQHENIVSVFDFGEHDGRPYIVMEYLKGEDLRDAIKQGRSGNMSDRLKIAADLASALEFIHRQGIIHRDIKPENIHIDPSGRVKLMDFGIAKTANLSLTKTGMAMGTPYYMSPEQVAGKATTPSVDIYAFGMLFFELLTGVRGITGETMEQVFFQILHTPLDVTKMENAGVPPTVRDLVMRCTAKNVDDRPQNLHEVIEVIRGAYRAITLTGQAAQPVKPAPITEQAPPVVSAGRPGKSIVIAIVAVIGILTAISVALIWSRRVPAIPGMVYYETGSFKSGPNKTPTEVKAYFLDDAEVSNGDFADFCRAAGCPTPEGAADLPVTGITIAQARAFAQWKGKRLPTALEWERAARGLDGARFPWGDNDDPGLANLRDNPTLSEHKLMPVRSFRRLPAAFNMAGNASEFVDEPTKPSEAAVAMFAKNVDPPATIDEKWAQVRGGSYNTPVQFAVAYEYQPIPERFAAPDIGFRCAKNAK